MSPHLKLNAFGRRIDIERADNQWIAFYCGTEGKRRKADDIPIPATLPQAQIILYLNDLLHEWASEKYPAILPLKQSSQ